MLTAICVENYKKATTISQISIMLTAMDGGARCNHNFIFNDDGFEVCNQCGVCTTNREQRYSHTDSTNFENVCISAFSNILTNNHIGYEDEINKEYNCIKTTLRRGYPNIVLFAFCTYNILMKNGIHYSMAKIEHMFKLKKFSKYYCQIEKNESITNHIFDVTEYRYVSSSINHFLAEYDHKQKQSKIVELALYFGRIYPSYKQSIILSSALFMSLKKTKSKNELLKNLSNFFSVSIRTLQKVVNNLEKSNMGISINLVE
jgi:uncharacterized cysteine cluster protein YcgN (CxxCxxCC family)